MTGRSFSDLAGRQIRTSVGKADSRRKLIGAVHAAARALGEEDRRAIYAEVTGKRSLTEMTLAEIGQVLDRFNRNRPRPMAHRPHVAKVRALWWTLYWLGEAQSPADTALDAFVRRQTGIDGLRFLDHRNAPAVIEALKAWAARAGVRWPTTAELGAMQAAVDAATAPGADRGYGPAGGERLAVMDAIWWRLVERREVGRSTPDAFVVQALKLGSGNRRYWTTREIDEAIKLLGKKLRRAMDRDAPAP